MEKPRRADRSGRRRPRTASGRRIGLADALNEAERLDGAVVFRAGAKINADGEIETAGGRVLGVTARAATLQEATTRAY
jgi:phosphoribosylamine-glycine ligase